jgi:hypothetical protein
MLSESERVGVYFGYPGGNHVFLTGDQLVSIYKKNTRVSAATAESHGT